jgi:uncharacterized delta-60 repeat protein
MIFRCIGILAMIFGLTACSSENNSDITLPSNTVTSVLIQGADQVNTNACIRYDILGRGEFGQPVDLEQDTDIRLTATGQAQLFEDNACTQPNALVTIAQANSRGQVYVQNATLETFAIAYQGTTAINIEVVQLSQNFTDALGGCASGKCVTSILPMSDGSGRVYAGGNFTTFDGASQTRLLRLMPDGTLDSEFNIGNGPTFQVNDLVALADQSGEFFFTMSNGAYESPVSNQDLIQVQPDGTRNFIIEDVNFIGDRVRDVVSLPNGEIVLGGGFTTYASTTVNRIAKLDAMGNLQTAFNQGAQFNDLVNVLRAHNGQFYVGGNFTTYNGAAARGLARLNSDGTLDATFNTTTGFTTDTINSLSFDEASNVLVGGGFTAYKGQMAQRLVKIKPDGSPDPTFSTNPGFNLNVLSVLAMGEKVYVGGAFTSYAGQPVGRIVRLDADGAIDASFDTGTGFNDEVSFLADAGDQSGDIYVGGNFTQYNGQPATYLIRLNADGQRD